MIQYFNIFKPTNPRWCELVARTTPQPRSTTAIFHRLTGGTAIMM